MIIFIKYVRSIKFIVYIYKNYCFCGVKKMQKIKKIFKKLIFLKQYKIKITLKKCRKPA